MEQYKRVKLKPKKESSLKRFHPWIFSGAIASVSQNVEEGDVVNVYAHDDTFLGVGHYQVGSIAVRILSFREREIDADFFAEKLEEAYQLRQALGLVREDNNTYRLIHGEGDSLPGLIVDVYGKLAVVQAHSVGMHISRSTLAVALQRVLGDSVEHIYYKSENTLPFKAPINPEDDFLMGGSNLEKIVLENNLKFLIDWEKGQKTGFFIDQRENRRLLEKYAHGRSVLNMFCYTGGFSVYALRGGARAVMDVDSSSKAVMLAGENIKRNFGDDSRYKSATEDGFKFLKEIPNTGEYDLIVLDPPAFAKHRGAVRNALQGYKKLNAVALEKIAKGGIVFTFSCSQVISREQFRLSVFSAAAISGREVRILHQLSQPADHPINIYHPEGEYLKGLVLYVS